MRLILSIILASLLLGGCGQKGPVYKEAPKKHNQDKHDNQHKHHEPEKGK